MDSIDVLNQELRLIEKSIGREHAQSFSYGQVQAAQRFMISEPSKYPMADILFMEECKRRKIGACEVCKLRFKCWTA
jgi:hypothetical protein